MGWDGLRQSQHVLEVAAAEAVRRDRALAIVTVLSARRPPDARERAGRALAAAKATLADRHFRLPVTTHCLVTDYVHGDVEPFASACLLVLGTAPVAGDEELAARIRDHLVAAGACRVLGVGAEAAAQAGAEMGAELGVGQDTEHPPDRRTGPARTPQNAPGGQWQEVSACVQ